MRPCVLLSVNALTLFRNGVQIDTTSDSCQATTILAGFQVKHGRAVRPIYARSLVVAA